MNGLGKRVLRDSILKIILETMFKMLLNRARLGEDTLEAIRDSSPD